ncbi:unnamed protein product [Caenorhabditis bovis]|uniref:Pseudouridine synthase II N-terminal domain-containing protein n=1 Tax=Caenorhabditis bovis TaxID=2654633 RepID=A0A8S1F019_9PELO|nr:unnamed protein product [Caenorhabditis bovis]
MACSSPVMSSRDLWRALSGVLCVYKHSGISTAAIKKLITNSITESVTQIESTSRIHLPAISLPIVEPHEQTGALVVVGKSEIADYRYHPLVCGASIRSEDIRIEDTVPLDIISSGVCLFGLNDGCDMLPEILAMSWPNVYRIDGILGRSFGKKKKDDQSGVTDALRVSRNRIEKVLMRMESEFRALSFKNANVDMESDEAFELARKGLPRSQLPGAQNVYSIELNWFKTPRFTITVQTCGENDEMLKNLVNHIGVNVGTGALAIRVQRQFFGPFSGSDALLEKQLNLQNIIRNISLNSAILEASKAENGKIVNVKDVNTMEAEKRVEEVFDGLGLKESISLDNFDAMRPAWPRYYE